ncbi:hypothetical protein M404DRAFT_1005218 [Pisolithus tinctorius Marx 270]|uniref:Uncharacterized protein n=1 Tax=Pisolithus tinctorius Marx 270 TaxID=870435 RepID=A0A0C3NSS1_PISTI|nr:hypothetical protein M404DRAFT_1005218 [Pisolithus tinctorius Marx 270]
MLFLDRHHTFFWVLPTDVQYVLEETTLHCTLCHHGSDPERSSTLLPPSSGNWYYFHVHLSASDRSYELDLLPSDHHEVRMSRG